MTIVERFGEGAEFKGLYKLDNDKLEVFYYLDLDRFRYFAEGPMIPRTGSTVEYPRPRVQNGRRIALTVS
jgi:hypothetical protein